MGWRGAVERGKGVHGGESRADGLRAVQCAAATGKKRGGCRADAIK